MNGWTLVYEGYRPPEQGLREALCTLGNGYFATRGACEECHADGVHYPGTYLAGGYDRLPTEIAGRTVVNEDLVNFPNWLPLSFRVGDGHWFDPDRCELLDYRVELDLRHGLLKRTLHCRDGEGRETRLASQRLVHMKHRHLAAILYTITPENWSGPVTVRGVIDGSVDNAGVPRYRDLASKHLEIGERGPAGEDAVFLVARTVQSRLRVAEAARLHVYAGDGPVPLERRLLREPEQVGHELQLQAEQGRTLSVEKVVALYSGRDRAISEPSVAARQAVAGAGRFAELLPSHVRAWRRLWRRCDVELSPAEREQLVVRVHIFHMLQTVSLNTIGLDVSVPARGLHGEAYRGHIFWDELYILPFLNLRLPQITRSLLMYRYRRLGAARRLAREAGYAGAMYPWQSGSDGREETQVLHLNPRSGQWGPDYSRYQRHVNAAIAYNVWQYYSATGDVDFMNRYGGEMLLELARFFASLSELNPETGRYEIAGVVGPDEYHEMDPESKQAGLRNNAYTNVMAVWVIERALDVLAMMAPDQRTELREDLGLEDDEVERWRDILHRMTLCFMDGEILCQFEGYEELSEFDWEGYRRRLGDIQRLDRILKAEHDTPDRYKASKQPDVLMLFYLLSPRDLRRIFERLGYTFHDEAVRRTLDYYLKRTSHGSTLSKVVYASVMDRFDRTAAWELFREALESDVADVQGGTTPEGIHLGAMAGTVDIVLRHYAGIDTTGAVLGLHPRLPEQLDGLRLRLKHRGRWYDIRIDGASFRLEVEEEGTAPILVNVLGMEPTLNPGSVYECDLPPRRRSGGGTLESGTAGAAREKGHA